MSGADSEAPEKQALRGKIPDSENKFLPSFAGLTVHEQLRRADSLLQGPHLQGQNSASRAVAAGSLPPQVHREHGLPQPPKWAKPGVSLRG